MLGKLGKWLKLKLIERAQLAAAREASKKRETDWSDIDKALAAAAALALALLARPALAQGDAGSLIANIFRPFIDIVAVLFAISFGVGIISFLVLIFDAVFAWTIGGYSRAVAVSRFLRAAETLAIIPLVFFIAQILKMVGVPQFVPVADILYGLLERGWALILGAFK